MPAALLRVHRMRDQQRPHAIGVLRVEDREVALLGGAIPRIEIEDVRRGVACARLPGSHQRLGGAAELGTRFDFARPECGAAHAGALEAPGVDAQLLRAAAARLIRERIDLGFGGDLRGCTAGIDDRAREGFGRAEADHAAPHGAAALDELARRRDEFVFGRERLADHGVDAADDLERHQRAGHLLRREESIAGGRVEHVERARGASPAPDRLFDDCRFQRSPSAPARGCFDAGLPPLSRARSSSARRARDFC